MLFNKLSLILLILLSLMAPLQFATEADSQTVPDIERILQSTGPPGDRIRISLVADKTYAQPGDEITLTVQVDRACFLTVVNVDPSGNVIQLWPNRGSGWDSRVSANAPVRIPGPGASFRIQVDGSQPVESILAYASTDGRGIIPERLFREIPGTDVKRFAGDSREFVAELQRAVEALGYSGEWGTAQVAVRVGSPSTQYAQPGMVRVMVEMRVARDYIPRAAMTKAARMDSEGFRLDGGFGPVPMKAPEGPLAKQLQAAGERIVLVRGSMPESRVSALEAHPDVVKVWPDKEFVFFSPGECPVAPCDCEATAPKGTVQDVVRHLGVDKIWDAGYRGDGMVIGIVDSGITAAGRFTGAGKTIRNVIGGSPDDWGTITYANGHGNMCATDALGMAPNAKLYDLRIANPNEQLSSAGIRAFEWAIQRHRKDGTPHILSNSWGVPNKEFNKELAEDPNHPFTRKVIEALNEGILVLFAAGNCGQTCPDTKCKTDVGPGKSIWGPNGHVRVMSIGAANVNGKWIGYSSQGPAALEKQKPDFCGISHFRGFYPCDNGTSAACPVAAGVLALFKQAQPWLSQESARLLFRETARDIGPPGWDQHSGAGIMQPIEAFKRIKARH